MRFPDDYNIDREDLRTLYFIILASLINIIEGVLPKVFPFLRLGVSNIVVIYALFALGSRKAFLISIFKTVFGSFVLGRLFTPMFLMGLCGSLLSVSVMIALHRTGFFSVYGISAAGGTVHNTGQLIVLGTVYGIRYNGKLLGLALLLGLLTGIVNAFIFNKTYEHFSRRDREYPSDRDRIGKDICKNNLI